MDLLVVGVLLVNAALFTSLAVWTVRETARHPSPRLRMMGWVVALVCSAFLLGSLQRLALQADRHGLVPDRLSDLLLGELQLLKSLLAFALGLAGLVMVRRLIKHVQHMDRVVSVLTERAALDVSVSELGLTPRELEVLELVATGVLTDSDLARALSVSPATAKSHVKNILRKAGMHNRRELVLLGQANHRSSTSQ